MNNNNNNLNHLPTELISQIIPHLSQRDLYQCSLVNKRFYILTNPLLWASPQIRRHNQQLFTTSLLRSPHLRQQVHALRTTRLNERTTLLQWMVCFRRPQLTSLTIDDASNLTNDVLISFLRNHHQLETLVLKDLPPSIQPQSLKKLGRYCHQLKHLTLAPYCDHSISIFTALAAGCQHVKSLDIVFPHNMNKLARLQSRLFRRIDRGGGGDDDDDDDDDDDSYFDDDPDYALIKVDDDDGGSNSSGYDTRGIIGQHLEKQVLALVKLRHLEHLRLQWLPPDFGALLMTTKGLKHRTTRLKEAAWPHLTRLELGLLTPMNDRHAIALIQSHPRLQHLSLAFSLIASTNYRIIARTTASTSNSTSTTSELTDRFLAAIPTCLPDLKILELLFMVANRSSVTSFGLRQLVRQCRSLTHVSFPYWHHIKIHDFPEVRLGCLEDGKPFYTLVSELDQKAINKIRLGTE